MLVATIALTISCAPARPSNVAGDPWHREERTSKKTLHIAELGIGTGVAASAFGGATMGIGKAIGGDQGEVAFWMGVGTLGMGVVSAAISLVVLGIAGIEYATGD
jgi:hypothetical protein